MKALFPLGQICSTPNALQQLNELGVPTYNLLLRHVSGDFGDLNPEDIKTNRDAIKNGARIFSSYRLDVHKIWIITEADRSVTTLLLPEDY
jgi:hypothetical protein